MDSIYEWLYDHYAEPQLNRLPAFSDDALRHLAEQAVPDDTRDQLDWADALVSLRLECCTAAFSLGVRLGMALR